jgi:hypothetical protein
MRLRAFALTVFACLGAFAIPTRCRSDERRESVQTTLLTFLNRLRPHTGLIAGDTWGWRLRDNGSFTAAFDINGRAIGVFYTLPRPVLFDLRNGDAEQVTPEEVARFMIAANPYRLAMRGEGFHPPLDVEARSLVGGGCVPAFSDYVSVHRGDKRVSRPLFVVGLLSKPVLQHTPICVEGAPPERGSVCSRLFEISPAPIELSDGTISFFYRFMDQVLPDRDCSASTAPYIRAALLVVRPTCSMAEQSCSHFHFASMRSTWNPSSLFRQALRQQYNIKIEQ